MNNEEIIHETSIQDETNIINKSIKIYNKIILMNKIFIIIDHIFSSLWIAMMIVTLYYKNINYYLISLAFFILLIFSIHRESKTIKHYKSSRDEWINLIDIMEDKK